MYENYLIHYGTLGMRWGQRRAGIKEKIGNIQRSGSAEGTSDVKRFKYSQGNLAKRSCGPLLKNSMEELVGMTLTGELHFFQRMNKKQKALFIAKKVAGVAIKTGTTVAIKDSLTNHALKRYDSNGKMIPLKNGKKQGLWTSTDTLQTVSAAAMTILPAMVLTVGALNIKRKATNEKNEASFNRWGGRLLSEKVNNIVWQSKDLETAVIDGPIILNKHKN